MTISRLRALRVRQIQLTSNVLESLGRSRSCARIVRAMRRVGFMRALLHLLIGYRRPYPTLAAAEAAIAGIANGGHTHPELGRFHLERNIIPRPSDYAALFHLSSISDDLHRVHDLGGSIGNLFYCYDTYLRLPRDLTWQINDLPDRLDAAKKVAAERNAHQLTTSTNWQDASGADLLICSGSLHYFPIPLPEMIATLPVPPRYVLINRTPFTDGPTIATTQDGIVRVACVLYNQDAIVTGLSELGYEVVDRWQALESSLYIPGYPEYSVPSYAGMFFRRRSPDAAQAAVPA